MMTRRQILAAMLATPDIFGQMSSRGVKPAPRGKQSGLPFQSRLTDVARQAGLTAPVIYGDSDRNTYIIEGIGCGAAFLDYDNDGWLDVLLLSGTHLTGNSAGATNRLYRNNRDGTFKDVTERAGLLRTGWAYGVTVGDYNNDGYEDIFITYWGQNVLYRNNGDGTFTDVTKQAGLLVREARFGTGCTFTDYDRDGNLDLFIANYAGFDPKTVAAVGKDETCNFKGIPVYCGPRGLPPERCLLYRNNGDGTFTDVTERSGIGLASRGYGLTAIAADFDDDGWPDIYVACDSTPSLLFLNNRDGTFSEAGLERGVALNETGQEQAGMGLAAGDVNLDGRLDLLKTHFSDDTVALYLNSGKIGFRDVTLRSGLAVETRFVGWGVGIEDFDNDGLPDVFWVTGNAFPEPGSKYPQYAWRTPRILFRNVDGGKLEQIFEPAGSAIMEPHASRGCAFGDFDNDGDVDILIVNLNEPPSLLRNDTTGGHHWLKVKAVTGQKSRIAVGARITTIYGGRKHAQAVLAQSSFLSVNDSRLHFGLGSARTAQIQITWPSGRSEQVGSVDADVLVTVKEGAGVIRTEKFL